VVDGSCARAQCFEGPGQGLFMAKWKRKKYEAEPAPANDEEYSPLGLSLLEQFASGMSVPWLQ